MNAIDYLIQEHDSHRKLLSEIERDKLLFSTLREELIHHVHMEEVILYPGLLKVPTLEKIVREAWEEHNLIMGLIQEMDDKNLPEKVWDSKFAVLKKLILIHLDDEEKQMFPQVRGLASEEILNSLGDEMIFQKVTTPTEEIIYPEIPGSHQLSS